MLKKLFYASASILMLALAYHLGASTATAQSGLFRVLNPGGPLIIEVGGAVYTFNGSAWEQPSLAPPPVPASSLLVGDSQTYMTVDGTTWVWNNQWQSVPLPGSPTPAAQPTFGQLKAQYRK